MRSWIVGYFQEAHAASTTNIGVLAVVFITVQAAGTVAPLDEEWITFACPAFLANDFRFQWLARLMQECQTQDLLAAGSAG
jgi:uncharacterized membrane protein